MTKRGKQSQILPNDNPYRYSGYLYDMETSGWAGSPPLQRLRRSMQAWGASWPRTRSGTSATARTGGTARPTPLQSSRASTCTYTARGTLYYGFSDTFNILFTFSGKQACCNALNRLSNSNCGKCIRDSS